MAEVYFAGDGHLFHDNICKFRPQCDSVEGHNAMIMEGLSHITKRDKTFFMGDWVFKREALDLISQVPGQKHLIMGNHDDYTLMEEMLKVFDHISGDIKYKEFWLSHIPIHSDEMRGKLNIYAHTHNHTIKDWRYFCTSMEQIDYHAVSLQEIRKEFTERRKELEKNLNRINTVWTLT